MAEALDAYGNISNEDNHVWDSVVGEGRQRKCIRKDTDFVEEPNSSGALDDKENYYPCSSSPELQVLEHTKDKSHITVDLTLEDDDCEVQITCPEGRSRGAPVSTSEPPTVFEISDDENEAPSQVLAPFNTNSEVTSLSVESQHLSPQSSSKEIEKSSYKKPKMAWLNTFDEESDTMSVIRELNQLASLPRRSQNVLDTPHQNISGPPSNTHNVISTISTGISSIATNTLSYNDASSSNESLFALNIRTISPLPQETNISSAVSSISIAVNLPTTGARERPLEIPSSSSFSSPPITLTKSNEERVENEEMSILGADVTINPSLSYHTSAFQAVNPGSSSITLLTSTCIQPSREISGSTSAYQWNGAQPSTSTCSGISYLNSPHEVWNINSIYNSTNGGYGPPSEYTHFPFNASAPNASVNNTAGINHSQSSVFINTNSSHSTSDSESGLNPIPLPQHSSTNSLQASDSIAPVSQRLAYSQTSSNLQTSNGVMPGSNSNFGSLGTDTAALIKTYLETPFSSKSQNQMTSSCITESIDKTLDTDMKPIKLTKDPYTNPPSPEGLKVSCHICLDSIKTIQSTHRTLCSTVCGHIFCSDCLEASMKQKKECPMCRRKLNKKQYHPLFL
ncbi:hypothetical protein SK128_021263 [Halocaridina rubra]|uniref:RING-type domain-containing protein n=1 Tax=Halocaridina rubra TaxID=373956 RepID=A0AAN9A8S6_HALRR